MYAVQLRAVDRHSELRKCIVQCCLFMSPVVFFDPVVDERIELGLADSIIDKSLQELWLTRKSRECQFLSCEVKIPL